MSRHALITGGSGGIGKATALAFARDGYDITVQYNGNREGAYEAVAAVESVGRQAVAIKADITDRQQTASLFRDSAICLGPIDILVNNAGIADVRLFTDITHDVWQHMLDVNLTGAYNCCHEVLGSFIARGQGSIVNVSSVWGMYGAACEVHYSAAKAGVIGLTQALAKELGPSGIRVNCVAPGFIDTEMNREFDSEARADVTQRTPLCRLGRPEDVAQAIVFLAGEKAAFITGAVLPVTGGFC